MAKKSKYRIKPVPVAILAGVIIALIVGAIMIFKPKNEEAKPEVNISNVGGGSQEVSSGIKEELAKVTVKIDSGDCTVVVGNSIKLTATVLPANEDKAVVWKSSDTSVMDVTNEGIVTGKKAGMAALTATVGNVSDAIVITWTNSTEENNGQIVTFDNSSSNKGNSNNTGSTTSSGSGNSSSGNTSGSGSTSNTGSGSSSGGNSNTGSSSNVDSNSSTGSSSGTGNSSSTGNDSNTGSGSNTGSSSGNTSSGSTSGTGSTSSSGNTGSTSSGSGNTSSSVPTVVPKPENPPVEVVPSTPDTSFNGDGGMTSTQIASVLPDYGFKRFISNVFSFTDNGNYCGEVIIESDVAIIYIKQRNASFEAAINNVLSGMLGSDGSSVWNAYINSGSDTTFTVGDRQVRIVKAIGGGHSQIAVWN